MPGWCLGAKHSIAPRKIASNGGSGGLRTMPPTGQIAAIFAHWLAMNAYAPNPGLSVATRTIRCRNGASMPEMGRGRGHAALQMFILLSREKIHGHATSHPRRTAIRKLQDQRAKDLDAGDTHSESWSEEFDRPASSSPRIKPTLPNIGFLERPDLSKW